MAKGVFSDVHKVVFVDGEVTTGTPTSGFVACGPGTGFPMEVTLDQLAEIIYRVKDASYTSGSLTFSVFGIPTTVYAPTTAPTTRAVKIDATAGQGWQVRGYCKKNTANTYTGTAYDAGSGFYYADVSDNEYGIWAGTWDGLEYFGIGGSLIDAFAYASDDRGGIYPTPSSDWWGPPSSVNFVVDVYRGNRVAVVKVDPADGFFAPTNQFFIEFEFYWESDYAFIGGSTNIYSSANFGGNWSANAHGQGCNYVIRLASGDVTCPIYIPTVWTSPSGSDVIHEATEWWPYAKTGGAVWNTATGALL